jgi:hypothetical protein
MTDSAESEHTVNSVDATAHQPLVERVTARKHELEMLRDRLPETDTSTREQIGFALASVGELLTGDLEKIPAVVAVDLNRWLERNKHLAIQNAPDGTPSS